MIDKDLQSFFRLAKSVSLSREEREKMREEILAVVRTEGVERQGSAVEDDLKPFLAAARSVRLQSTEKREAWKRIEAYMALRPGGEEIEEIEELEEKEDRHLGFFEVFSLKMLSSAVAALFIVVVTGGGLAFAAEGTLPGDMLYPFKVYIAENLIERLTMNPEAKARWEARLAEKRLEELEELAARTRLRAEVSAELSDQFARRARRVRDRILQLTAQGEVERAAELTLAFESSLQAHQAVLAQLTAEPEMSGSVEHAMQRVEGQVAEVHRSRERATSESDTRSDVLAAVTQSASRHAERQLKQARVFAKKVQNLVSAEEYEALTENLNAAEQTLAATLQGEGDAELSEAYESVQTVIRDAVHMQQLLKLRRQGGSVRITVSVKEQYEGISIQPHSVQFRMTAPLELVLQASPDVSTEGVIENMQRSSIASEASVSAGQDSEVRSEVRSNAEVQWKRDPRLTAPVREHQQELRDRIQEKHDQLREEILNRVEDTVEVLPGGLQGELLERGPDVDPLQQLKSRLVPVRWVSETMPTAR